MRTCITLLLTAFITSGCHTVPFQKTHYMPLKGVDPAQVRAQFIDRLPASFETINSTVFAYRFLKVSCLGPARIDIVNNRFTVIGMNHVGVKLFELNYTNGAIGETYVFPELQKHENFAKGVCEDIARIYLDLVPPETAHIVLKKRKVIFRAHADGGVMEYIFAGPDQYLTEKRFCKDGRKIWSVRYYEYTSDHGKVFPGGVVLRHYGYNYYLVIRLKEILEHE